MVGEIRVIRENRSGNIPLLNGRVFTVLEAITKIFADIQKHSENHGENLLY